MVTLLLSFANTVAVFKWTQKVIAYHRIVARKEDPDMAKSPGIYHHLIKRATALYDLPQGRCRHFTFILRKHRVLSLGWNKGFKTHPASKKLGYKFANIHSELDAVNNAPYGTDMSRCVFVNLRINRFGELRFAKPCQHCLPWIMALGPKALYYSTDKGFEKL